jgi:chemotaxis protein CheC
MLNTSQKDVLTELVNVYVGQAASLLSEMTGQEIVLRVPEVYILPKGDSELDNLSRKEVFAQRHVVSSSIRFSQGMHGKAFLIFPAVQAKFMVNACLGEPVPASRTLPERELLDTDIDVLREIANVILNSVMGGFGNLLNTCLEYSIPEVELLFMTEKEDQEMRLPNLAHILILQTDFSLSEGEVTGIMLIAFSLSSLTLLMNKLDAMLSEEFEPC